MRLLVRGNAHRQLDGGGTELASSPDTLGRERWRWDLRIGRPVDERAGEADQVTVPLETPTGSSTLSLTFDPAQVHGSLELLAFDSAAQLERSVEELLIIVARGAVLVENRHRLDGLDVMVLEGDDPVSVAIEPEDEAGACAAIARIAYVDGTRIAWVP